MIYDCVNKCNLMYKLREIKTLYSYTIQSNVSNIQFALVWTFSGKMLLMSVGIQF